MDLKEDAMWKMAEKMGMPKSAIEAIKAKQKNGDKSAMPDMGKMMSMMQAMTKCAKWLRKWVCRRRLQAWTATKS